MNSTKVCTGCKSRKPDTEFNINYDNRSGRFYLNSKCVDCYNESRRKEHANKTPFQKWQRHVYNKYGITALAPLLQKQGNACPLCSQPLVTSDLTILAPSAVDHDHRTNSVREVLCQGCNIKLAGIEDFDYLIKALPYLIKHKSLSEDQIRSLSQLLQDELNGLTGTT